MSHTIVHFEIPADSMKRAIDFYQNLFGWQFVQVGEGDMEYWLIMTVPVDDKGMPTEPGVNGGMMKRVMPEQTPVNYISVESIDEYAKKIEELGGQVVVPKMPVPGRGWFAHCIDTEGNAFAIWENDTASA